MSAIIAALLGSFLSFSHPAPVVAYDYPSGVLMTSGHVTANEVLTHGGKAYKAVLVRHQGSLTTFYTVPRLAGNGQQVIFYPR